MNLLARISATGFFVGLFPIAPGTFGSLLAVVLYWLIPGSETIHLVWFLMMLFFLGVWSSGRMEIVTGKKDNSIIVIDEIVGQLITLVLVAKSLKWLAIGLFLFRLFDIVKPFPVRSCERLKSGWGVMMDDVVAGVYAALCLQIVIYLFA
jgi:phosphatidylglycerophosphatase A